MSLSFEDRLRAVETQFAQFETVQKRLQTLQEKVPIKELLELHPGTALTYQSNVMAPILYRKQAVLASAESLRADFKILNEIAHTLQVSSSPITEQAILESPILQPTTVDAKQLDDLGQQILELQKRVQLVSTKLDYLLENYKNFITALSEKLVLCNERIESRQGEKGGAAALTGG